MTQLLRDVLARGRHSLVVRIAAFALAIVFLALVARLIILTGFLREQVSGVVSSQQASIATYVASDIDHKIQERLRLIGTLANRLPAAALDDSAALRTWLAHHQDVFPLFSEGMVVVRPDGAALADYPEIPGRLGLGYADSDWLRLALATGGPVIGRPYRSRIDQRPILVMAAPVRSPDGAVVAVLGGVSALNAPGFLDLLHDVRIGETGGFLLVSPHDQLFVAATDPAKTLTATPPPDRNPLHDRAMEGFRGTGVTVNIDGVEELSAIASVPTPNWFLVARLPTAEALGVLTEVRRFILRNSGLAILVVLVILVATLTVFLRPLLDAATAIRAMAEGRAELGPIAVVKPDEVGDLVMGFNALVQRLRDNEDALRASEARMAHMAHHDRLTGLPNRAMFEDRLAQALARSDRSSRPLAVMFMDLDGFKPVNDTLGHDVGDIALRQVAQRLQQTVRHADTVARLGGDEFVILLTDVDDPQQAAELVARKCHEAMSPPVVLGEHSAQLGLSIGIAVAPRDGTDPDLLLSRADKAMYAAKQRGRGRHEYWDAAAT